MINGRDERARRLINERSVNAQREAASGQRKAVNDQREVSEWATKGGE